MQDLIILILFIVLVVYLCQLNKRTKEHFVSSNQYIPNFLTITGNTNIDNLVLLFVFLLGGILGYVLSQ
jgi:hypothetical protein